MPKQPADRPSRRLDAIFARCAAHGIRSFKAGKLEGIGEGIEFTLRPPPRKAAEAPRPAPAHRGEVAPLGDPDLRPRNGAGPIDELDLVAQGREGPVPEVS